MREKGVSLSRAFHTHIWCTPLSCRVHSSGPDNSCFSERYIRGWTRLTGGELGQCLCVKKPPKPNHTHTHTHTVFMFSGAAFWTQCLGLNWSALPPSKHAFVWGGVPAACHSHAHSLMEPGSTATCAVKTSPPTKEETREKTDTGPGIKLE